MSLLTRASLGATLFASELCLTTALHAAWTFQSLGDITGGSFSSSAYDVSDDGSAVVGQSNNAANSKAFRWTQQEGMSLLENSSLYSHSSGVSADGSVAVGWIWNQSTNRVDAYRWTEATGAVPLGDLPGGGVDESYANDVSADGSVVVGLGHTLNLSTRVNFATRWTAATGQVSLGDLPGGITRSAAFGVSRDSATVVGEANSALGQEAFLWTVAGGMIGLGDLASGVFQSHAEDVLADGNVVVGYGHSTMGREAFRWTQATGMVGLGDLPGGDFDSWAWGGSIDGTLLVGSASTERGSEAFIWDQKNGMRNLHSVAELEYGLNLVGWTLSRAFAMSPDGRIIVGEGFNPDGDFEAWMIKAIPEPSSTTIALVLSITLSFGRCVQNRKT